MVVSQYYPPETHGSIPRSVAHGLAERGHDVRVVTTFPNHPYGRLFDGWRQRFRHVEADGPVTVRRVPMLPDHSGSAARRVLAYLSFAASSVTASWFARRADVVYVYGAQPTAAIVPMLWRRAFGVPVVLHVQDIWPESVTGSGMLPSGRAVRWADAWILRWLRGLHRSAAHVVAIAPGAARLLQERGADCRRTSVILNWATTAPDRIERPSGDQRTRVVYAGNLGPNQGLDTFVQAMARCRDLPGLEMEFIGDGLAADALRSSATALGVDSVRFSPAVPRDRMSTVHATTDFAVVALRDVAMSDVTIPSKLQDALVHGVPVIAAVPGDAADVVRDGEAGFVVAPGDVDALETAIRSAHATSPAERRRLSDAALTVADRHMHAGRALDHLDHLLRKAAS
ncbi:glycosyltransferase family 4 protein [Curtobacterium sp. RRHDQ66]|uniref:glycosyltransferase family 4 protein n=1 Tax=Curtobacterium guangdongense TaxID=3413380 RepID=UPI003BF31F6B